MQIVDYQEKYRDDMIFMVLESKNSQGFIPRLNSDLLDVRSNYLNLGTRFWLAIDDNDRVIGCLGFNVMGAGTAKLHRFYIKANLKRTGIGSALLKHAEDYIFGIGYREIVVHIGGNEYEDARKFFPARGYVEYQSSWLRKIPG